MPPEDITRRRRKIGALLATLGLAVVAAAGLLGGALSSAEQAATGPAPGKKSPAAGLGTPSHASGKEGAGSSGPSPGTANGSPTPLRLRVPVLGITAPVVRIRSTPDRVLRPPANPAVVGWWSEGAAPGSAEGSAILVGHTVHTGGGVFDDMEQLGAGDRIEVETRTGRLAYRTTSVEVLSKTGLARQAEEIFAQSGPPRLVLVTCEGWDGRSFNQNIVAIARPV